MFIVTYRAIFNILFYLLNKLLRYFVIHNSKDKKNMSYLIVLFQQVFTSSAVRVYLARIAR